MPVKRYYFTMVQMPTGEWRRVGKPFHTKEAAKDWLPFVKSAWHGMPTRVQSIAIRRDKTGQVLPLVLMKLSTVYNLEVSANGETRVP